MPPRIKVTKKEITEAALVLVRKYGADAVNARNVALELNCSTQPIFSNFATMDELWESVYKSAEKEYWHTVKTEAEHGDMPE